MIDLLFKHGLGLRRASDNAASKKPVKKELQALLTKLNVEFRKNAKADELKKLCLAKVTPATPANERAVIV